MIKSCILLAQCKNEKGEVVDSKLFKDLLSYSGNDRKFTKKMYRLSLNTKFLETVKDQVEFDENGEITLKSLLSTSKVSIQEESLLAHLNKIAEAGTFEFDEALAKVEAFNRNKEWKKDYIATIERKGSKYQIQVEKKTGATIEKLRKAIYNQSLQRRLINLLADNKVAVEFLDDGHSRYSTENVEQATDGLYNLIKIINGEQVTEDLAEESGHFIIGALGDNILVKRLEKLLTPEVQREALGKEEYDSKVMGMNSSREVAGALVGKALLNQLGNNTVFGRLANRIATIAKKVFYSIKADDIQLSKIKAQQMAERIAKDYVSREFEGTVENAIDTLETLYNQEYSYNVQTYKKVVVQLKSAINELKAMNSTLASKIGSILTLTQLGRESTINSNMDLLADRVSLEGLAEAAELIIDIMTEEMPNLLNSVDFQNTLDFATNLTRNGHALREAHLVTHRCIKIAEIISDALTADPETGIPRIVGEDLSKIVSIDPETKQHVVRNLNTLSNTLSLFFNKQIANTFYKKLLVKEQQFCLKFLENGYGSRFVNLGTAALFNWSNFNKKGKHIIEFKDRKPVDLASLITNLENDINFFDKFLAAMADSGDIIGEVIDKIVNEAVKGADDATNQVWDSLRALEKEMHKIGVHDPVIFLERDKNGKLTGNIIDDKLYGVWEQEYKDEKQKRRLEFEESKKNDIYFQQKPEEVKTIEWQAYWKPLHKQWHKRHSIYNLEEGMWEPNNSSYYRNEEFRKLSGAQVQWLMSYMTLKSQLDGLTGGAMPLRRAPQFRGTFMNKVRNRGSRLNPLSYGKGIWEEVKYSVWIDVEDAAEMGSELTYNKLSEDMFQDAVAFEKEKLNRLPLFGINKLTDMDTLSTDLFGSTLAYAGMATHYAAMNQIVDTVEITKEILKKRSVRGERSEDERDEGHSKAFTRFSKYIDKQIYSVSVKPIVVFRGLVLNKLVNLTSRLASTLFLGGNVAGGIVNLGTGSSEIFKEALSGEHYGIKDWMWAHKYYFSSVLGEGLLQSGNKFKDDKMSLIIRHFNILGNNTERYREYSTYQSRSARILSKSILFPYTSGDHYMQSMSYLAMMHKTKFIDLEGKTETMWDAYKRVDSSYVDAQGREHISNKFGKTLQLSKVYFITEDERQEYILVKSILDEIGEAQLSQEKVELNQKQLKYLESKNLSINDIDTVKGMMLMQAESLQWNTQKEAAFSDKAGVINLRLHGIYNNKHKTLLHQHIITNALLSMRGYALGMIQRRFGVNKRSIATGQDVEGNYITLFKVLLASKADGWNYGKTLRAIAFPFSKTVEADMKRAGFSPNQYRNMRRTYGDIMLLAILQLIILLTARPVGDDDEDEDEEIMEENLRIYQKENHLSDEEIASIKNALKKEREVDMTGVIFYIASRLKREQLGFLPYPSEVMRQEWSQISSLNPAGMGGLVALTGILVNIYGDIRYDPYEKHNSAFYENMRANGASEEEIEAVKAEDEKLAAEAEGSQYFYQKADIKSGIKKGSPKWKKQLGSYTPYFRSLHVLYNGWEAIEAFDYGRQVKN